MNGQPTDPTPRTDLCEQVVAVLTRQANPGFAQIRVSECDGGVVLEGVVTRYYDRQMAIACAQLAPGVDDVIDRIVVRPRSARPTACGEHERRTSP